MAPRSGPGRQDTRKFFYVVTVRCPERVYPLPRIWERGTVSKGPRLEPLTFSQTRLDEEPLGFWAMRNQARSPLPFQP